MNSTLTLAAEWDSRVNAVMIAYPAPHTDWGYMLEEARQCFDNIIAALACQCNIKVIIVGDYHTLRKRLGSKGLFNNNIAVLDVEYNDTWARDFGPLTLTDDSGNIVYLDFKFNGWGMKYAANLDNQVCNALANLPLIHAPIKNYQDFVLEGGSIETDGKGTLLTTTGCLLSPNRNGAFSQEQIEEQLKQRLGAKRVLWINNGELEGDDTDGHIDTLVRMADEHTLAYVRCDNMMDSHFHSLSAMERELRQLTDAEGNPYNLVALPMPSPVYDDDSNRLPATYANFLILPHNVLLPVYNQPENDRKAIDTLRSIFPQKTVIPIDCNALIKQHGSLHCVTMQMIL